MEGERAGPRGGPPLPERWRSMRAPRAAGEEGEAKKSFVPSEAMEPWQPRGGIVGQLSVSGWWAEAASPVGGVLQRAHPLHGEVA